MRAPWSHKEQRPVHASEPHAFRPVHDAGLGTGLSSMSGVQGDVSPPLAMTGGYLRALRCDVPGCGKDRNDPVHEPAE